MQVLLTRSEEMYLLVIWELGDNAYGVTIKRQIGQRVGREVTYGALYFTLDQLVKKGLVQKRAGDPTGERGGRTRFFYTLSEEGLAALKAVREHQQRLWDGIGDLVFK